MQRDCLSFVRRGMNCCSWLRWSGYYYGCDVDPAASANQRAEGGSGRSSVCSLHPWLAKPSRRSPPLQRVEQHLTAYPPSTFVFVPLFDSKDSCVLSGVPYLRTVTDLLHSAASLPAAPSSAATHPRGPTLD